MKIDTSEPVVVCDKKGYDRLVEKALIMDDILAGNLENIEISYCH